eukprot:PhF_6_TR7882/c0_g1_i1/m.11574
MVLPSWPSTRHKSEAIQVHMVDVFDHAPGIKALHDFGVIDDVFALHIAAKYGSSTVVSLLIEIGMTADVNAKDDKEMTALMYAAFGGHCDVVQTLLTAGADPSGFDALKQNVLHKVTQCTKRDYNTTKIFTFLLSKSKQTDLCAQDVFGHTPIHYAILFNHSEFVFRATAMLHPNPIPLDADFTSSLILIPLSVRALLFDVFGIEDVSTTASRSASKLLDRLQWPEMRTLGYKDLQERRVITPSLDHEKKVYKSLMASLFIYREHKVDLRFMFESMASLPAEVQCDLILRLGTTLLFGKHLDLIDDTITEIRLKYVPNKSEVTLRANGAALIEYFSYDMITDTIITTELTPKDVLPSKLSRKTEETCRSVEMCVANVSARVRDMSNKLLRSCRVIINWSSFDTLPTAMWDDICRGLVSCDGILGLHDFLDRVAVFDTHIHHSLPQPTTEASITFTHAPPTSVSNALTVPTNATVPQPNTCTFQFVIPFYVDTTKNNNKFCCKAMRYLSPLEAAVQHNYYFSLAQQNWGQKVSISLTLTTERYNTAVDFINCVLDEIAHLSFLTRGYSVDPVFLYVDEIPGERQCKTIVTVRQAMLEVQTAFSPAVFDLQRVAWVSHVRSAIFLALQQQAEKGITDLVQGDLLKRLRSYIPTAELAVHWVSFNKIPDDEMSLRARLVIERNFSVSVLQPLVQGLSIGWDTKVIGPLIRRSISKVELRYEPSNVSWLSYDPESKGIIYNCAVLAPLYRAENNRNAFLPALQIASIILQTLARVGGQQIRDNLMSAIDTDRAFGPWCSVHGTNRVVCGGTVVFRVECRNIMNENSKPTHIKNIGVQIGGREVELFLRPEDAKKKGKTALKHTMYVCFNAPMIAKRYRLKVFIRGELITVAPRHLIVVNGSPSAKRTIVSHTNFNTIVEGKPAYVQLTLRDANSNTVLYGHLVKEAPRVTLTNLENITTHAITVKEGGHRVTFTAGPAKRASFCVLVNDGECLDEVGEPRKIQFDVMQKDAYEKYIRDQAAERKKALKKGNVFVAKDKIVLPKETTSYLIRKPLLLSTAVVMKTKKKSQKKKEIAKPKWVRK